jgi:hypothetical protein
VSISNEIGYQRRQYSVDTWTWEIRPIVDQKVGLWYWSLNPTLDRSFHGESVNQGVVFSPWGLSGLIADNIRDDRRGKNMQLPPPDLLRQSIYSCLAGYEGLNDAERLSQDPTFRLIGSEKIWEAGAALFHWFETEVLSQAENLDGMSRINRELISKAEAMDSSQRVVLDMDSTEFPVFGEQEQECLQRAF